jgi:hypothetical protein
LIPSQGYFLAAWKLSSFKAWHHFLRFICRRLRRCMQLIPL